MTLKPLTSCLVVLAFCACGEGALPMAPPAEPVRVADPFAATTPSAQRFALTSLSKDGWSLEQHAASPAAGADFTLSASGCRGWLANEISSTRFRFCKAGSNFAALSDVPSSAPDCENAAPSFRAGGSGGAVAIGDGYVVLLDGQPTGQLRVVDHTLVPGSWDGEPVQVTLEYVAAR